MNSALFDDWIESWLQAIPSSPTIQSSKHKNPVHGAEMTPPPSASDGSRSPPKKQKTGYKLGESQASAYQYGASNDNTDDEATPKSASQAALNLDSGPIPLLFGRKTPNLPPSQASGSQRGQSVTGSEGGRISPTRVKRPKSPVKGDNSLYAMELPVIHIPNAANPFESLPQDVHDLFRRIQDIADERENFIPSEIQHHIKAQLPGARNKWFSPLSELDANIHSRLEQSNNDPMAVGEPKTTTEVADEEFRTLRRIKAAADTCAITKYSEYGWNMTVHMPLLEHALSSWPLVRAIPSMTATMATKFAPATNGRGGGDVIESKMIDFALVLWLNQGKPQRIEGTDDDSRLAAAITNKLWTHPIDQRTINQTLFPSLQYAPIGCNIETKLSTSNTDGRLQLSVWTASWFYRMQKLLPANCPWITIPLLLVVEHDWTISFACHRGNCIEIVEQTKIGDTSTLINIYQLNAVLRELAGWIATTYREWLEHAFTGAV